jgi:ubiquinone/menaquinone biosynthesis C-methylase UbiE
MRAAARGHNDALRRAANAGWPSPGALATLPDAPSAQLMSTPTKPVDYAGLYDGYWQRPDRFGEHSFDDPTPIVAEILRTLGTGRILDVGCGMGLLVRTLLSHGVDAHGLDVSAVAVAHGNSQAPNCFHQGSILELPFPDGSFDAIVSTDCMEHLHERDVPKALAELHRVSRRGLYLRLATTPDRDGHWHLTVQGRAWWENQLFAAGFRKHPRAMAATSYEQLELDGWQITLVLERLSDAAIGAWPLSRLLAARDLHMDMLRETGRRSDAHVARYHLAAGFVRPNDVVLDVACGMGYGAAVLAANSEASRVIGVDLDAGAIDYDRATTGTNWPQTEFRAGDATKLGFLPDRSVDLVTSFETLEHVPDPEAVLAEFARVLKPAGRVIVSVPHMWVDDTGRDPNPHHLHVYDWPKLRGQLQARFLVETAWAQTAGGGMKLGTHPRRIVRAATADPGDTPAEWWLALAMKSPSGASRDGYDETSYPQPAGSDLPHVIAFARDYENPWLVKALVSRGHRLGDASLLATVAHETLQATPVADGSADAGAALCVLAYRLLEQRDVPDAAVRTFLGDVDVYCARPAANPNVLRWQVSLHYVAARLLLLCGRRDEAATRFRRCGALDVASYSPLLGTKTVDAWLRAGLLAITDGDATTARTDWQRALQEVERLLRGDWRGIVGDIGQPLAFGLREATDLVDLAARVARALVDLPTWQRRHGHAWEQTSFGLRPSVELLERVLVGSRRWNERLTAQLAEVNEMRARVAAHAAELAAAQATIAAQQQRIAALELQRGLRGTLRGLFHRERT